MCSSNHPDFHKRMITIILHIVEDNKQDFNRLRLQRKIELYSLDRSSTNRQSQIIKIQIEWQL